MQMQMEMEESAKGTFTQRKPEKKERRRRRQRERSGNEEKRGYAYANYDQTLSEKVLHQLGSLLEHGKLRRLKLVNNGLGNSGLGKLLPGLCAPNSLSGETLEELVLMNQGLDDDVVGHLCNVAWFGRKLKLLDVRFNDGIGLHGARELGRMVATLRDGVNIDGKPEREITVRVGSSGTDVFDIQSNMENMGLDGIDVCFLCPMLQGRLAIVRLNLSENPIGDEGMVEIGGALKWNFTVQCLELRKCGITTLGWKGFYGCLYKNCTLKSIDVQGNPGIRIDGSFLKAITRDSLLRWPLFQFRVMFSQGVWNRRRWHSTRLGIPTVKSQMQAKRLDRLYEVYLGTNNAKKKCRQPGNRKPVPRPPPWTPRAARPSRMAYRVETPQHETERDNIAAKVQSIVRMARIRRKWLLFKTVADKEKRGEINVQGLVRMQSRVRGYQARKELKLKKAASVVIQKIYRGHFIKHRMVNLAVAAVKKPVVRARLVEEIKSVMVGDCGDSRARGLYRAMARNVDGTVRYVRQDEKRDDLVCILERNEEQRAWIIVCEDKGVLSLLYANREEYHSLKPPLQKWQMASQDVKAPVPKMEWHYDSSDVMPTGASVVVQDSGCTEANGRYVDVGESDGVLSYRKVNANGNVYWLRRLCYRHENGEHVWIISRDVDEDQVKVFYINDAGGILERPPSSNDHHPWKLGEHGKLPIPLVIVQSALHENERRQSSVQEEKIRRLRKERERVEQLKTRVLESSGKKGLAMDLECFARKIQTFYRRRMLLNLAKCKQTLKELQDVRAISVHRCGDVRARGTYQISGMHDHSISMRYTRALDEGDMYVIERTSRDMWALLYLGPNPLAPPVLMYVNKENGYSLKPPRRKWQTAGSTIDAPSPVIEWEPFEDENNNETEEERRAKTRETFLVMEAGSVAVNGRYCQQGWSDSVPMYRSLRDPALQMRRVVYGSECKLWVMLRLKNTEDESMIYYCNPTHGQSQEPPEDGWIGAQSGTNPCPIVVHQMAER